MWCVFVSNLCTQLHWGNFVVNGQCTGGILGLVKMYVRSPPSVLVALIIHERPLFAFYSLWRTLMIISFVIVLILTKLYLTWWVAVTLVTPGHWSPPEPDTGHQGWPWHCQHSVVSLLSEKQFCLFEKISFQQCNNNSFECFVVSYLCLSENNSNPRKSTEAINQPSDI